jgi:SAM-dependent methyltransferase
MVVNAAARSPTANVVWHDLECGGYRADLPLWRELAGRSQTAPRPGPILDVGAGAGRVALDLAAAGHRVTALDLDPLLLAALRERAAGTDVETVCADARSFELDRRDFALCLVPMQTIQLLGGPAGRGAFLCHARAHLRPGGVLACAIVAHFEEFDYAEGEGGPAAETVRLDGVLYVSRAIRVSVSAASALIERERRILGPPDGEASATPTIERNAIELDRVGAAELEREAAEVGLRPAPARHLAATDDHVASIVVMLHV